MVCVGVGSTLTSAVPLATGAASALFTQAATQVAESVNRTSEAMLGRIADRGEELARRADEQAEARLTNRRWHMAAADAVGVNAAIRMIEIRASRLGHTVELPAAIKLDDRSLADVIAWLAEVQPRVRDARKDLDQLTAVAEWQRLVASLSAAATADTPSIAEALRGYQEALARRHSGRSAPEPADLSWVEGEVRAALARLDPDVNPDDREAVLLAAARVAQQTDRVDADVYLRALRRVILKEANSRAAARRSAASWLLALDEPVVRRALEVEPVPWAGVAKRLRDVVTGVAELTPALRKQARAMGVWAADTARVAYRLELLRDLLVARGYHVVTSTHAMMRIARGEWSGEHQASLWLDPDGSVDFALEGLTAARGDEAVLRETARDAELRRNLTDTVHEMSHNGVHGLVARAHEIQHHHDAVPVEQTPTATRAVGPRERRIGH
jgi:hypothetical protein